LRERDGQPRVARSGRVLLIEQWAMTQTAPPTQHQVPRAGCKGDLDITNLWAQRLEERVACVGVKTWDSHN
jgi:hypothetical protein